MQGRVHGMHTKLPEKIAPFCHLPNTWCRRRACSVPATATHPASNVPWLARPSQNTAPADAHVADDLPQEVVRGRLRRQHLLKRGLRRRRLAVGVEARGEAAPDGSQGLGRRGAW